MERMIDVSCVCVCIIIKTQDLGVFGKDSGMRYVVMKGSLLYTCI
jgi:hypothetical protein